MRSTRMPGNTDRSPRCTASSCRKSREYHVRNSERINRDRRERYANDPAYRTQKRLGNIRWTYGIEADEYLRLVETQRGLCAICQQPESRNATHTAQSRSSSRDRHIRDLLCSPCNTAIGLLSEDPVRIQRVLNYLRKHNAPAFLEQKLKREYPNNPSAVYGTLNAIGAMRGNQETAKGRALQAKHDARTNGRNARNAPVSPVDVARASRKGFRFPGGAKPTLSAIIGKARRAAV